MSKNPYENIRLLKKFVKNECKKLQESNKTFEDIYNIVFYRDMEPLKILRTQNI